jgi:sugar lactone lactonase YvrE
MTSLNFEVFSKKHNRAELGESPCQDPDSEDLWWVDVTGCRLLKTNIVSGETKDWETPEYPGFVVLISTGIPAVGMQSGIYKFMPETGSFEVLIRFDQQGCRFNDATVDQHGRLWASTMALDAQPRNAAIHLVTADRGLDTFVDGLSIPNGLAVDLERERIFYSDSHPDVQSIWVAPLAKPSGPIGEAALFASTGNLKGRPDGAVLDQEGFYWIAGVDGSELYVFDLNGTLHDIIPVPFPAPTKISFSGDDNRLIVATSKNMGKNGGRLARARLPQGMPAGIAQPFWNLGTP